MRGGFGEAGGAGARVVPFCKFVPLLSGAAGRAPSPPRRPAAHAPPDSPSHCTCTTMRDGTRRCASQLRIAFRAWSVWARAAAFCGVLKHAGRSVRAHHAQTSVSCDGTGRGCAVEARLGPRWCKPRGFFRALNRGRQCWVSRLAAWGHARPSHTPCIQPGHSAPRAGRPRCASPGRPNLEPANRLTQRPRCAGGLPLLTPVKSCCYDQNQCSARRCCGPNGRETRGPHGIYFVSQCLVLRPAPRFAAPLRMPLESK